jgi:serine/threonine protein kinase
VCDYRLDARRVQCGHQTREECRRGQRGGDPVQNCLPIMLDWRRRIRNGNLRQPEHYVMGAATWQRLKGVIADAMARPPRDRQAFVRERCTDPSLVPDALSLLAYGETNPHFVARVTEEPDHLSDAPDDLPVGTRIEQYEVVGRLGRGGMGQVFLGYDHELHRSVALKCLLSEGSQRADQSRIRTEAQAAAAITHPHIAAVYHVVDYGSRAFIVMEYVAGENLSARMRRERLTIEQAVTIGRQLASALGAAHSSGVIHGDLKPANVQVTLDGSVKILDFGIAMILRPVTTVASSDSTTVGMGTQRRHKPTSLVMGGTPPYMSPEQILGQAVDERADIFSLGVVFFEMVTGRRPFAGADTAAILRAQQEPAPRADAGDRNVPRALADVIARALQAELRLRYQSVAEMDRALALAQPGPRQSARELIKAWSPRVAIAILLAIAVLGFLGAIKTFGFNNNFGRTGPHARFGVEPLTAYVRWGMLGIGPKLLVLMITTVAVMAAGVLLRGLELIGPIGRVMRPLHRRARAAGTAIGFDRPSTLAQALAGMGVAGVVFLVWYFGDLIAAFQASFNSAPVERLLPMRESAIVRGYYQLACSILTVTLGVGLVRVLQLRRRQANHESWLPVAALVAVIFVTLLLTEVPYRSLNHRDFERVQYAGERCYIIGESGNEFLILCTAVAPPRNRVVQRDDPQLKRLGIIENVFRGLDPSSSNP